MSEQLDSLELLVKIRSEGLENLRAITDATKATQASAKSTGDSIDGLAKHLRDLGGAVKGYTADVSAAVSDMVKNQVAAAGKAAEDAEKRELNAIEKTIRALERKASLVGKSGAARAGQQQANILGGFDGKATEEQIARVGAALTKLNQVTDSSGRSFASSIRMWIQNPLYAAGAAAEGFLTALGPVGIAIGVVGVAATGGAFAVYKLADSFTQTTLGIQNFAARIGSSTTFAQEFSKTAQRVGVDGESLAQGMRKLSQGLAEGGLEGKLASDGLRRLGIEAYDAQGRLKPMEQLIPSIMTGLGGVTNFADQQVLSLNILGRSYRELVPLFKTYQENLQAVKDSGVIISPEQVKKNDEVRKQIVDLGNVWEAMVNKLKARAVGAVDITFFKHLAGETDANGVSWWDKPQFEIHAGGMNIGHPRTLTSKELLAGAGPRNPLDALPIFQGVGMPDPTGAFGLAARTKANHDAIYNRASSIINGADPQAGVKNAQDDVNETLKKLDSIKNLRVVPEGSQNLDELQKELGVRMSILKAAQAQVKFKQELKAMQDLVNESIAKELDGEDRINQEFKKRVHDIDPSDSPAHKAQLTAGFDSARQNEIAKYRAGRQAARDKRAREADLVSGRGAAELAKLQGARDSSLDLINGRLDPNSPAGIEKAAQDRSTAITQQFSERNAAVEKARATISKEPSQLKRDELSDKADADAKKNAEDEALARFASETQRLEAIAALKRRQHDQDISAERQIAAIQAEGRKSQDSRDSQRAAILAGLHDVANPGNPVASVQRTLQQRLSDANKNASATESSIADRENDKSLTADMAKVERAKALKTLADEKGEAELKYEEQIAEMQKKRLEEYRTQAHELAGALLTRGGLAPFIMGQAKGTGQQILGNALQPIVKNIGESVAGSVGNQRDANGQPTGLGKLLQGTFLAPHDEQKITLTANTTSTDLNTAATDKLTKTMAEIKSSTSNPSSGANAVLGSLPAGQAGIAAAAQMASDAPQMADILARDPLASGGIPGLPAGFAQAVAYANTGIDPSVASDLSSLSVGPSGLTGSIMSPLTSSMGTISKGLTSIASFGGMMANPFGDRGGTPGVNGQPGTDNGAHGGVMGIAAAGADIAVGALGAVSEFKKGGARGALGGAGAILGTAAALDPEPISKAILGIAAMGTSLVKGLLGDPKAARDRQETAELTAAKYTAPAPINLAIDSSGHAIDQNYKGQLRVLNAMPTASLINQATGFGPETNTTGIGALLGLPQRPGDLITTQQRRLGMTQLPAAPTLIVQVQTMDSKSFNDNAHNIADAMKTALNNGHPVANTIASKVRPI